MARRTGKLFAVALAAALMGGVTALTAPKVSASQGTDGCNPNRSGNYLAYSHTGWKHNYSSVAGVQADVLNYSPYVAGAPDDNVSAWSMLDSTASPWDFAQVGWLESPGNSNNSARATFMEYDPSGTSTGVLIATQPYETLNTSTWYSMVYAGSGQFQGAINGVTPTGWSVSGVSWAPNEAQISGETHSAASQMPGGLNTPETFTGSQYYDSEWGSAGWHNFGTWSGGGSTSTFSDNSYGGVFGGCKYGSNTQTDLTTWDTACPASVSYGTSTDTIPVGAYFDAAGTGTGQSLYSQGTTQTNGPYTLSDQTDGNLVLYDGHSKAIWDTAVLGSTDYLKMQGSGTDALVEYQGYGGGQVWTTTSSFGSYSSPYAVIQDDGNFVTYGSSGRTNALWNTGTYWDSANSGLIYGQSMGEGAYRYSPSNGYYLTLDGNGNLYLKNGASTLWSNTGSGRGLAVHLDMQTDGNLVLYQYAGPNGVLWYSGTNGTAGSYAHMVVGSSGTFSVYDLQGTSHWTS